MKNKENLFIVFAFFLLFVLILAVSLKATNLDLGENEIKSKKSQLISTFKKVHYFKLIESKKYFQIYSTKLQIKDNNFIFFKDPKGKIFQNFKQTNFSSKSGVLDQTLQVLNLNENVSLTQDNIFFTSDFLTYNGKDQVLYATGNIYSKINIEKTRDDILLKSQLLTAYISSEKMILQGGVVGKVKRQRAYEEGVAFESQRLVLAVKKSRIEMSKSVKITKNNYVLTAENAEILLENHNKRLKYYVLYDDVKLIEKSEADELEILRKAYAEKIEGYQSERKIILSGAPRVEQGNDVVKGYQIILKEDSDIIEVDDAQTRFSLKGK